MEEFPWLLLLCVAMFLGAYLAGLVPISMGASAARLKSVTIFGAGLLVGTALIVIIPEGVAMHYESQMKHSHDAAVVAPIHAHAHLRRRQLRLGGGITSDSPRIGLSGGSARRALAEETGVRSLVGEEEDEAVAPPLSRGDVDVVGSTLDAKRLTAADDGAESAEVAHSHELEVGTMGDDPTAEDAPSEPHGGHAGTWAIGAALAFGFAFQLVVDRLSDGLHSHGGAASIPSSSSEEDAVSAAEALADEQHSAKSRSAMVGLVVHAMVDGVALGAAIKEGDAALGMLVFAAIMLHKAPSSFGLASYLLHHGITKGGVQKRLVVFSSAAPFGALATYGLLSTNLFKYTQETLAILFLFSGGTFLYVATAHVLPEVQAGHFDVREVEDIPQGSGNTHSHSHGGKVQPKMKWSEVWLLVAGILLPLLVNVEHGH